MSVHKTQQIICWSSVELVDKPFELSEIVYWPSDKNGSTSRACMRPTGHDSYCFKAKALRKGCKW